MNKILQMSIQNQTTNHNILTHTLFNFRRGLHNLLVLFFLFLQTTPPATAQPLPVAAPPGPADTKKSMAGVMAVVAILFFISGFLSLYTRNCAERRNRIRGRFDLSLPLGGSPVRSIREPRGLHSEVIESFPTFLYATVKGLRIAKETLACAVCLDEFKDDDTLRLIPKCNHVFHPCCIDLWLESHTTCPVCRANLVPRSEDVTPPFVAVHQFPDEQEHQPNDAVVDDDDVESPKGILLHRCRTMNQNRTPRSRSTGFLFDVLFPRSNSTGHDSVVVGPGENCERFTLRLPEEVRSQLLKSTLKRTSSCVSFRRMSSGRKGYRTRSVGSGRGRNYLQCQHERFCNEERWGFTLTTPFFNRSSGAESTRKTTPVQCSAVASDHVFGERSSDRLSPSQPG